MRNSQINSNSLNQNIFSALVFFLKKEIIILQLISELYTGTFIACSHKFENWSILTLSMNQKLVGTLKCVSFWYIQNVISLLKLLSAILQRKTVLEIYSFIEQKLNEFRIDSIKSWGKNLSREITLMTNDYF